MTALLEADAAVKGLVLVGSCTGAYAQPDAWSDIDLLVVVDDAATERYYPETGWLKGLGAPYALSRSANAFFGVIRAYFTDGRHVDFVIASESSLEKIDDWPSHPLQGGGRCLFSRSSALDRTMSRALPPSVPKRMPSDQFEQMTNDFRFKGMLAVAKVARSDLLVALHLSLDLIRDCCVLAMQLRDWETGTDHHRTGDAANACVVELPNAGHPYSAASILDSIEQSALAFDRLAHRWSDHYRDQRQPLLDLVNQARRSLSIGDAIRTK